MSAPELAWVVYHLELGIGTHAVYENLTKLKGEHGDSNAEEVAVCPPSAV